MKKIYFIPILAATAAFAQPVINQSNVTLDVHSEVFIAETNAEIFDPGSGGANKTWDFSNISLIPVDQSATTSPIGTPSAGLFPTANFCSASISDTPSSYVYYKHDMQKMELLGETYPGVGVINYSSNPKTYIEFPYTYNKVISDTYKASLDDETHAFTTTYDAYGTLILEFGTYYNVVRQKIVENGQTDYIWFHVNPFFPIIQTALADGAMGVMKNASALATDNFKTESDFRTFPNPVSDSFHIGIKNFEGAAIAVYDTVGNLVASEKASQPLTKIDLGNCSSGIYFIKVTTKENQASTRKIVKK